ncbi:MAG: G1 family endopeptidase, partial [Chloroflexi bacterium]|nr:G1 family endopeptidase [Chloroflexota bacterium]
STGNLPTAEFTDVKGTWTVPQVDCTKNPNSEVGVWVGLDGVESPTVEQAGISSRCRQGVAQYSAWVEIFPGDPHTVDLAIAPNDQISAEVRYLGGQLFRLSLTDLTTGRSFAAGYNAPGANLSSAEWIVEAPLVNGTIATLATFSPITISGATVTADGQAGSITNPHWGASQVEMDTPAGTPWARASRLDASGSSFTVTVQQ